MYNNASGTILVVHRFTQPNYYRRTLKAHAIAIKGLIIRNANVFSQKWLKFSNRRSERVAGLSENEERERLA